MSNKDEFYTMKGYSDMDGRKVTPAMEDYLEMICRTVRRGDEVRVRDIARKLHVRPSSVTKMIQQLSEEGLLKTEKYGSIKLTETGRIEGEYLLYRHEVLNRFLSFVNKSDGELEQVEKIEHFLDRRTVENLDRLIAEISKKFFDK